MNATNETWIERLKAAGPMQNEALAALRDILIARLRRMFHARTGVDEALLEDVAQEALLKTLDSLDQFQGRSRFTTWATTIAVHVAFTELRRRHWKDVSLEQVLEAQTGSAGRVGSDPDSEVENKTLIGTMYQLIDTQLTDKQRTALLSELKGMPLEEIGRRMGSNRNAIYKLTHDARKRLKRALEAAGYTAADLQTA